MCAKDGDAFIVVINEDDNQDEQEKAFIHEMLHIWHNDHDRKAEEIEDLEAQRRRTTEILKSQK